MFFLSYTYSKYLFFHSKGFCIRCFNCKDCDVIKRKWIIWKFFNCLHCGCKYTLGWRCFLTFFSNLFTFQNGGQPISGGNNYPLRGIKSTIWEGGTRAASFVHAPYILQRHGEISNKYFTFFEKYHHLWFINNNYIFITNYICFYQGYRIRVEARFLRKNSFFQFLEFFY